MNKKTIITALLALAALTGQGQTFTPVVEDSIDFVITGKTTAQTDSVAWFKVAPFGGGTMKVPLTGGSSVSQTVCLAIHSSKLATMLETTSASSWRKRRQTSISSQARCRVVTCSNASSAARCVNATLTV